MKRLLIIALCVLAIIRCSTQKTTTDVTSMKMFASGTAFAISRTFQYEQNTPSGVSYNYKNVQTRLIMINLNIRSAQTISDSFPINYRFIGRDRSQCENYLTLFSDNYTEPSKLYLFDVHSGTTYFLTDQLCWPIWNSSFSKVAYYSGNSIVSKNMLSGEIKVYSQSAAPFKWVTDDSIMVSPNLSLSDLLRTQENYCYLYNELDYDDYPGTWSTNFAGSIDEARYGITFVIDSAGKYVNWHYYP